MNKGSENQVDTLAHNFHAAVAAMYSETEVVNVTKVASACAVLLVTYFQAISPTDRILMLNETVEAILGGLNEHCDYDIN